MNNKILNEESSKHGTGLNEITSEDEKETQASIDLASIGLPWNNFDIDTLYEIALHKEEKITPIKLNGGGVSNKTKTDTVHSPPWNWKRNKTGKLSKASFAC